MLGPRVSQSSRGNIHSYGQESERSALVCGNRVEPFDLGGEPVADSKGSFRVKVWYDAVGRLINALEHVSLQTAALESTRRGSCMAGEAKVTRRCDSNST